MGKKLLISAVAIIGMLIGIVFAKTAKICQTNEVFHNIKSEHAPERSSGGYLLVPDPNFGKKVYLVNENGLVVKTWHTSIVPNHRMLDDQGNLWVGTHKCGLLKISTICIMTEIQKIAWDGTVLKTYKYPRVHHDFEPLKNGGLALLALKELGPEEAKKIQGGIPYCSPERQVDQFIVELDERGDVVWTWSFQSALQVYKLPNNQINCEIFHPNSIRYIESNPIDGDPAYLISARHISLVFMVNRRTGEVIWRSPENTHIYQHDARLADTGNVVLFSNREGIEHFRNNPDNQEYFKKIPADDLYRWVQQFPRSVIIELDPKTNQIAWSYPGEAFQRPIKAASFFNSFSSGVFPLKNGSVLITESTNGQIREVTRDKKVVFRAVVSGPMAPDKVQKYFPESTHLPLSATSRIKQRLCSF